MKLVRSGLAVIKENRTAYIVINAAYYGLVILGMIYVAFVPEVQQALLASVGEAFASGPLAAVGGAYTSGAVLQAMLLTFVVNLFVGTVLQITLPSLIIPFSGLLLGVVRSILWGLLLSPAAPELRLLMIPHSITLLLEGQGYILALLAVYVHGKSWLFPRSAGVEVEGSAWQRMQRGYAAGLRRTAYLYVWVVIVLAAAAIYEAVEVIVAARLLGGA